MKRKKSTRRPDRAANPMIPWLEALAAQGDERWEEALVALKRFVEMDVNSQDCAVAYQNMSACYHALERYDEALAMLDQVNRLDPDFPEAVHGRGVTLACAARFSEAIAAFELFARRWPKLARRRGTRDAIRELRRAQKGDIPPDTYLFEHLQEQMRHNLELGDFHLAEGKARRMITADPDRPEGHFALGVACLEQDRYPEALQAFMAAHARDPDYAPTLYNLGYTYRRMNQPEQAIPWLEQAADQDPEHLAALHNLGLACDQLGQRDKAVAWWQKALKKDPDYYPTQKRLHEAGEGPPPVEPPLPPHIQQLRTMTPVVKDRMRRPRVYRSGGVTLTFDGEVGFMLEDRDNARNATVYAGGPFQTAHLRDKDLLDLMGMVKLLLKMIDGDNTRDVAVLVYYADERVFNYQARFLRGGSVEFDVSGQFVTTEVPSLFKLRIDSDLSTPYGDPMQGYLIYLSQRRKPGILVSTLGLMNQ